MEINNRRNLFQTIFVLFLILSIAFSSLWSQRVFSHEGHAGVPVVFIKDKAALKKMLPAGAKIVRRKQPLTDSDIEKAEKSYGVDLDSDIYTYYLATDKNSKMIVGAAYVGEIPFRHGKLKYAVGIDGENRITQAAILGINEKYVVDFEGNVGKGLIADYAGLTLKELIAKADELASSDKATREFASAIRDAAVLLSSFIHGAK